MTAAALALPTGASAALIPFDSSLGAPASLNTAENLNYPGTNTAVPSGVVHTFHYGADSAIWNTSVAGGSAAAPATGQVDQVRLEGCAVRAPGGPAPLTQIHFQVLTPQPGGGVSVALTSQAFLIPTCGVGGASGSTVTTYEPINLCVSQGDYVGFNDEGGFVEPYYRNGVPYQVLAPGSGSTLDSFIRGNGTANGAVFSPADTSNMDGFAVTQNAELTMQAILGTGPDARYICGGGTKDAPKTFAPMRISRQTDGINAQRVVSVAIYCRPAAGCAGTANMTVGASSASVGHTSFNLPGNHTSHLAMHVSQALLNMIRKHHGVATTFSAVMGGQTFTQTVTVRIL